MGIPRRGLYIGDETEETEMTANLNTHRKLAYVTAISGALFVALLIVLHFVKSELDPTWNFISEYARGDFGWLMSLAFGALGISCATGAAILWPMATGWAGRIGSVLLGVSSIGMLLAALFVTDPINTPMDSLSTSGTFHTLGGQLNMTSFAILFLTISLVRSNQWKQVSKALWITVSICLLADVAFVISVVSAGGTFGPGVYAGLLGRVEMFSFALWQLIVSARVIRPSVPK